MNEVEEILRKASEQTSLRLSAYLGLAVEEVFKYEKHNIENEYDILLAKPPKIVDKIQYEKVGVISNS